jgi:abnormal spindle-like microcephaly-associated protein
MNNQLDSPCPRSTSSYGNEQFTLTDAWNDDTLHNLDYTAAINFPPEPRAPSLTKAKPRRALKTPSFTIHEDSKPNTTTATARQSTLKRKTQDGGLSILAQPAQRFQRPRVSSAEAPCNTSSQSRGITDSTGKRDVKGPNFQPENTRINKLSENKDLKKDVRRRTVYIPEDTTVPTVFMSLFSPLKSMDANTNNTTPTDDTVPIYSLEARIAARKKSQMSSAEKPRKAPLQQTRKVTQQSTIVRDVVGKNGGKENVPPGYLIEGKKSGEKEFPPVLGVLPKEPLKRAPKAVQGVKTSVTKPRKSEKPACKPLGEKSSAILMARTNKKDMSGSVSKKPEIKRSSVKSRCSKESLLAENRPAPTHLSVPKVRPVGIDQQYPRFSNDITNPAMYEDGWLSHQEVVITQLVNGLFDSVGGKLDVRDAEVLRHELLHIYQSDVFLLLYKRLQASILYGALSPPNDVLRRGSRLPDDLGLKKSFLNFWSDTYNLHALRGAAETIVGRKMAIQPVRSGGSSDSSAKQHKALKRAIEAYLDTFLIRNMDMEENGNMQSEGGPYRRTLLRSIMIIALLDKARLAPGNSLPRCLFTSSSSHKSSSAALQALANLLLPSMGDINRQVNHLDCNLSYTQHQLQDYDFHIHNLAVDLRDGVILTRLVEVLLYPSASLHARKESIRASISDATSLVDETNEYPLAQKLKFPCVSRAAKIFNVQIALGALKGVTGINEIAKELCADHIVDGYREKTIALLWLLVGKWGLSEMLDWDDARNEIVRLQKKLVCQDGPESKARNSKDLTVYKSHEDLLVKWASTLAQLQGLQLDNLTTSFADGKIFESIVSEYEGFLLGAEASTEHTTDKRLQSRLQALGCSSQFGRQAQILFV